LFALPKTAATKPHAHVDGREGRHITALAKLLVCKAKFVYCDHGCSSCRMAGPLKATTGLTGMVVAQYPHRMLSAVYQKILRTIKEMPEDYIYRKNTQVTECVIWIFLCKFPKLYSGPPFAFR